MSFADSAPGNDPTTSPRDGEHIGDRRAVIDEHILQHRILSALKALREECGYTLHEAIDAFADRYEQLRETRPQEFTVSREDYGRGVYT